MKIRNHIIKDVVVIKLIVMIGLFAYYVLPPDYHGPVTIAANMLWLWRT